MGDVSVRRQQRGARRRRRARKSISRNFEKIQKAIAFQTGQPVESPRSTVFATCVHRGSDRRFATLAAACAPDDAATSGEARGGVPRRRGMRARRAGGTTAIPARPQTSATRRGFARCASRRASARASTKRWHQRLSPRLFGRAVLVPANRSVTLLTGGGRASGWSTRRARHARRWRTGSTSRHHGPARGRRSRT